MKHLIAGLLAFTSLYAQAAVRERMNGGRQVEREIRWVWKYMRAYADSCVTSATECKDPEIRKVVTDLAAYLPAFDSVEARKWASLLVFVSEKDRPDLFTSDRGETHRLVVTGLAKFSPVYINTDRMNLPLTQWAGLLAHETAHHLGLDDDAARMPDRVGAEIARHFQARIQESSFEQFSRPDVRTRTVFRFLISDF